MKEALKTLVEFTIACTLGLTLAQYLRSGINFLAVLVWEWVSTTVQYWTWRVHNARKAV